MSAVLQRSSSIWQDMRKSGFIRIPLGGAIGIILALITIVVFG